MYIDRFIESCIFLVFFNFSAQESSEKCGWLKMFLLKVKLEIVTLGSKLGVFSVVRMGSGLSPLRLAMLETLGTW